MPISIDQLRAAARRFDTGRPRTLAEAHARGDRTAFLCHSHRDKDLVSGLIQLFEESEWRIYVDYEDPAMPDEPTRLTAARIEDKIRTLDYFLFLATPDSMKSRWCPWEIGYADGVKQIESIFIIPTIDGSGKWHGSEYLQLYRKIAVSKQGGLAAWNPGETQGTYLRSL